MCGDGGGDGGESSLGFGADVSTGNISGQGGQVGDVSAGEIGLGVEGLGFGHAGLVGLGSGEEGGLAPPGAPVGDPNAGFGEAALSLDPSNNVQVSFNKRGRDIGMLLGSAFFGPPGAAIGALVGGTAGSAIEGSGIEGGMDMSGDPSGGNVIGGPDPVPYVPYTGAGGGVITPGIPTEKDVPVLTPFTDPDTVLPLTPAEIDAMNKLAAERNLRFAPTRGEESALRSLNILSERDRLVGAHGPAMYKRKPRTVLGRRRGLPIAYDRSL